jgi:Domain of unknown function (DUF4157)
MSSLHQRQQAADRGHRPASAPAAAPPAVHSRHAAPYVPSWDFTRLPVFAVPPSAHPLPAVGAALASDGSALDNQTRAVMEPRFGYDFSRVRVHTGPEAQRATQSIGAAAFTFDRHIVLGTPPTQAAGRGLLAHELAHVIQQGDAGRPTRVSYPHEAIELAADRAAYAVASGRPARLTPQSHLAGIIMRQTPGHDRGYAGEQGMAFAGYPQPEWELIEGPSGAAGHGVTNRGFDAVAVRVQGTFEVHLVDNKSLARAGNVSGATALTKNLVSNLDGLITRVNGTAYNDFPQIQQVRTALAQARAALSTPGAQLPPTVRLLVTNYGGRSTGVTARLAAQGVQFRDLNGPPTAAQTAKAPPRPATPGGPPAEEHQAAPTDEPELRPGGGRARAAAGAAIKIGAQIALTAVVTEMERRELQQAIANAHRFALPFVEDLRSRNPNQQVYISLTIRQSSFLQFIPLEGWVPAEDKLELWKFNATTDVIDPPKVVVEDHSLDVLRPGKITWTTFTEPADLPASQAAITSHPELRSVAKLGSATATREWVSSHDPSVLGLITADEKARLINMLLDGWVSDEDIAAIRKLYTSSPSSQRADLAQLIERRIPELSSTGQRTALRVIVASP